jgi:hypothetical protein
MENDQLRFDGQIKWLKGEGTLQWSALKPGATTGKRITSVQKAVFKSGNPATNLKCLKQILSFARQEQRREQFQLVKHIIIDQLWPALIDHFGYPTMQYSTE